MSDTRTAVLSREERERGIQAYLRHLQFNGVGINFLNIPIISLLAVSFGATNLEIGYISSVFQFAGVLLIVLPRLLANLRMIDVFYYAWLARGAVCLLYAVALLMSGQAAVLLIIAVVTVFALLRIVAIPMQPPLQKAIMRPGEMGQTVVRLNLRMSISQLISQFTSFLLLSLPILSGPVGIVLLTYLGVGANTLAARQVRKIPSRDRVEYHRGKTIFSMFVESMRDRERALTLAIRWFGLAAIILFQFGVPYLRRSVGMPPNMVFLYTVFGAAAAIVAGLFLKPFADSIGSKPLLIITNAALAICAVAWAVSDPVWSWWVYFAFGFITFFFLRLWLMLTSRLVIKSIPEEAKVNFTAMMNFVAAISAILVGLTGGWLAGFDASGRVAVLHAYSFTYLFAAVVATAGMVLCFALKDAGSLSLRETAAVLLSTKNLRALLDVHLLDAASDDTRRETILRSLEQSDSGIATDELRVQLKTPLSWEKERILKALFSHPRPDLLEEILGEARDPDSYNRLDAIFALGAYRSENVCDTLRGFLDDPRTEVAAAALKSLARIDEESDYSERIRELLASRDLTATVEIDCITALARTDRRRSYLDEIFELALRRPGRRFRQMVYIVCTRPLKLSPPVSDLFLKENNRRRAGVSELIDEASQLLLFYRSRRELRGAFERNDLTSVWEWCRRQLSAPLDGGGAAPTDPLVRLGRAVLRYDSASATVDDTIAALYFTFQLLSSLER